MNEYIDWNEFLAKIQGAQNLGTWHFFYEWINNRIGAIINEADAIPDDFKKEASDENN